MHYFFFRRNLNEMQKAHYRAPYCIYDESQSSTPKNLFNSLLSSFFVYTYYIYSYDSYICFL